MHDTKIKIALVAVSIIFLLALTMVIDRRGADIQGARNMSANESL